MLSDIAWNLMRHLRNRGMDEESARRIARSFDQWLDENLRETENNPPDDYAAKNRAESAKFRKKIKRWIILLAVLYGIVIAEIIAIVVKLYFDD